VKLIFIALEEEMQNNRKEMDAQNN